VGSGPAGGLGFLYHENDPKGRLNGCVIATGRTEAPVMRAEIYLESQKPVL